MVCNKNRSKQKTIHLSPTLTLATQPLSLTGLHTTSPLKKGKTDFGHTARCLEHTMSTLCIDAPDVDVLSCHLDTSILWDSDDPRKSLVGVLGSLKMCLSSVARLGLHHHPHQQSGFSPNTTDCVFSNFSTESLHPLLPVSCGASNAICIHEILVKWDLCQNSLCRD